jgi:putative flippase GtrA
MTSSFLRFVKFGIVGGSGVIVNVGLLHAFTTVATIDYRIASIIAIECAVINNFLWNYFWTWNDRQAGSRRSFAYMLFKFHLSSGLTALVVNWGLLVLLNGVLRIDYHLSDLNLLGRHVAVSNMHCSNLIGIVCGAAVNFFLGHFWVFAKSNNKQA